MSNRLMDLVVLVAEMSRSAEHGPVELDQELTRRGYSSEEIEHATFWISSRPDASRAGFRPGRTQRVLSQFERMSLNTEAYDFLLRIENLGIIDREQFETILARAIPVGADKVRVEDVKGIACDVIFRRDTGDFEEEAVDRYDADGTPV
jgi:uncharacterized protein Smg (DUF494 family)